MLAACFRQARAHYCMSTTFQRRPDARRVGRCRRPTPAVLQQLSAGKPTCVDFGVCVGTVGQTKVTFGVMHHHVGVENAEHLRALRLVPNTSAATLSRYRVSSSWLGASSEGTLFHTSCPPACWLLGSVRSPRNWDGRVRCHGSVSVCGTRQPRHRLRHPRVSRSLRQ